MRERLTAVITVTALRRAAASGRDRRRVGQPGPRRVHVDQRHHAGPTAPGSALCSNTYVVDTLGQAGNDTDCQGHSLAAVLWEHGHAYDLDHLIGRSPLHLAEAFHINNRGELGCFATLPNGDMHVVLLVSAGLPARQGLSVTPSTSQTPVHQRAVARSIMPSLAWASLRPAWLFVPDWASRCGWCERWLPGHPDTPPASPACGSSASRMPPASP